MHLDELVARLDHDDLHGLHEKHRQAYIYTLDPAFRYNNKAQECEKRQGGIR